MTVLPPMSSKLSRAHPDRRGRLRSRRQDHRNPVTTSYQDRREQGQRGLAGGLHPGPDSHRRIDRRRRPRSGLTSVPGATAAGRAGGVGTVPSAKPAAAGHLPAREGRVPPQHHRPFSSTRPVIHRPTSRGRRRERRGGLRFRRDLVPDGCIAHPRSRSSAQVLAGAELFPCEPRVRRWVTPGRSGTTPGGRWLPAGGLQEPQPFLAAFACGSCPVTSDPRGRATRERAVRVARSLRRRWVCRCGEGQRRTEREVANWAASVREASPWKSRAGSSSVSSGRGRSCLCPVDLEPALGEQPDAVLLDELVEVPQGSDHHRAFAILADDQMMGQAVALPGGAVAVRTTVLWPLK